MRRVIDWKYTVAVTGLTLVGAWAAGTPGSHPAAPAAARAQAPAEVPMSEIESEALRLQARVRGDVAMRVLPVGRDPFRFASPRSTTTRLGPVAPTETPDGPAAPAQPAEPAIKLIGMATDESAEGMSRTAILVVPSGVLLIKVGDAIDDLYRVTAIDADAVELTTPDGVRRRLSLIP